MSPGPEPGSAGAQAIGNAHRGGHDHDKVGGFAADQLRAKEAGKRGGNSVKEKYGAEYYKEIGRRGGDRCKQTYGTAYYSRIGKVGAAKGKAKRDAAKRVEEVSSE